jgi:hypothetical protein
VKLGDLVKDWALGMYGIVVAGIWNDGEHNWEWQVLYANGELLGADTNDLQVANETR